MKLSCIEARRNPSLVWAVLCPKSLTMPDILLFITCDWLLFRVVDNPLYMFFFSHDAVHNDRSLGSIAYISSGSISTES